MFGALTVLRDFLKRSLVWLGNLMLNTHLLDGLQGHFLVEVLFGQGVARGQCLTGFFWESAFVKPSNALSGQKGSSEVPEIEHLIAFVFQS